MTDRTICQAKGMQGGPSPPLSHLRKLAPIWGQGARCPDPPAMDTQKISPEKKTGICDQHSYLYTKEDPNNE